MRLTEEISQKLLAVLSPYMGRLSFGNLRVQVSDWAENNLHFTNIAIVYETPGSSTNQINVMLDESNGVISFVDGDEEHNTTQPEEMFQFVEKIARSIPERRMECLRRNIRAWVSQGKSRAEVLADLNRLLRADLLGGTITHSELKASIQYCLELFNLNSKQNHGKMEGKA